MRRARIVLAVTLVLPALAGLGALLRPHTARTVPIMALGAPEAPSEGEVIAEEATTTTLAPETTTVPVVEPEPPTTSAPSTTAPPVATTEPPTTVGTEAPPTTEPPAAPETTTTTEAPPTTTTTLGNVHVAYYPDGMPPPQVQMPGMTDNPAMGSCHLVGTNGNGETVAEPCP